MKNFIKKYNFLYSFLKKIKQLFIIIKLYSKVPKKILSSIKLKFYSFFNFKPRELQLPITYKCNFDCVMCGMKTLINNSDFSVEELGKILENKLFSKIYSVGINGGEPFLKKDLELYVEQICCKLPNLKSIYIISNGFLTNTVCLKLKQIKSICNKYNVFLNISISVDGIGEMQNFHRGNKLSSKYTFETINLILSNKSIYCDNIDIICTITKHNIYCINEVEVWASEKNINVNYNIATIHKRINNEFKYNDFSVFTDEHAKYLAQEFFYTKFLQTKSEKYFALYLYLNNHKRFAPCVYNNRGVTLTPNCQILYCATFSDELGNGLLNSPFKIFFKNKNYRNKIKREICENCSHYIYSLSLKGYIKYCKELSKIQG